MDYEIINNEGEVTMRDAASGVTVRFEEGDGSSFVCTDMGTASPKEYVEISSAMTTYAYEAGLLSESSAEKLRIRGHRRELGRQLKAAREASGLGCREIERLTGVNRSVLARTEHGRANTTIDTVFRLAEAYGVSFGIVNKAD